MSAGVPVGFAEHRSGGLHVVAREDSLGFVLEAIAATGSLYEYALLRSHRVLAGGRAGVACWRTPNGEEWAVRHYWRGGAVARFLGDRYLRAGTPRPLAELQVSEALRALGVATPTVVAAVVGMQGAWYRGDIATLMVPHAADLAALTLSSQRWEPPERERAWAAAGALVARFFATGAVHADLNLRNLLVQRETYAPYLLDLDRCTLRGGVDAARTESMLQRFHRSRRKLEQQHEATVSRAELEAFERGRG